MGDRAYTSFTFPIITWNKYNTEIARILEDLSFDVDDFARKSSLIQCTEEASDGWITFVDEECNYGGYNTLQEFISDERPWHSDVDFVMHQYNAAGHEYEESYTIFAGGVGHAEAGSRYVPTAEIAIGGVPSEAGLKNAELWYRIVARSERLEKASLNLTPEPIQEIR